MLEQSLKVSKLKQPSELIREGEKISYFLLKKLLYPNFTIGSAKKTKLHFYFQALSGWDQTLSIWLGIQFRQYYGQIKDRNPNIF